MHALVLDVIASETARMQIEKCRGWSEIRRVKALTQKQTLLGRAAHLSSLSTPFSLMQLAMMMADATPSPLRERSIFSVGFVPLSSSI